MGRGLYFAEDKATGCVKLTKNAHTASAATASRPVGNAASFVLSHFIVPAVAAGQMAQLS